MLSLRLVGPKEKSLPTPKTSKKSSAAAAEEDDEEDFEQTPLEGFYFEVDEEIRWPYASEGGGAGGGGRGLGDWRSYVGTSILNTWNWNSNKPNDGYLERIIDIRELE